MYDNSYERNTVINAIFDHYEDQDIEVAISLRQRDTHLYEATATYTDKRLGTVKAHYVVLVKDGWRVEFQ